MDISFFRNYKEHFTQSEMASAEKSTFQTSDLAFVTVPFAVILQASVNKSATSLNCDAMMANPGHLVSLNMRANFLRYLFPHSYTRVVFLAVSTAVENTKYSGVLSSKSSIEKISIFHVILYMFNSGTLTSMSKGIVQKVDFLQMEMRELLEGIYNLFNSIISCLQR